MSFKESKKNLKNIVVSAPDEQHQRVYEFGPFTIDHAERQLLREGMRVPVTAKAFDTLLLLVQRNGHLVEKSEIMQAIWPDSFVEEGNLSVTIYMLRKALGDDGSDSKYIETIAKRGYRFLADVREVAAQESPLPGTAVEAAVLLPEAARRPASLIRISLGIAFLTVVVMIVAFSVVRARRQGEPGAKIRSLAVLPFRSWNSHATQDYLRLGLSDAIITKLASTGEIIVRPTSAVLKYADSSADPLSVGREQKVDAILAGYIETLPDHVRATVQLIRVSDGSLLWAGTFEQSSQQIFVLEDKVADRVAQSLSIHLPSDTNIRLARRDVNSKAYQLYLEGRYFWNKRTEEGLRRSIEYFQQATTEDAQYAPAYAGLADSYVLLDSYGVEPASQAYPVAKAAALKALQLDDSLAEAHASLGMVYFYYEWNWPEAAKEFMRAIALNPNYALAHSWYALNLGAMGRYDEALDQVRRAQVLDPLSLEINTVVGRIFYLRHQYDQSIDAYRKVIDLDPHYARAHARLGMTYAAVGAFGDALHEFGEAQRLSGSDSYPEGLMGYTFARSGDTARARKLLQELTQRSRRQAVPAFNMALICIGLGERDKALDWLAKAYQDRSSYMVYAKTEPLLDPIRSDPRFAALLHQMGFQEAGT
jgi:DNA-binding winged helix-turn-helix (wHTH) protein/TolB-like protein/Flp pilus assembly protein TadD